MRAGILLGLAFGILLLGPASAEEACTYSTEHKRVLSDLDHGLERYQTLYSGGDHWHRLDTLEGSVNLFRVINGLPALSLRRRNALIYDYPFASWKMPPVPFQNDDWRLSVALKAAIDQDFSAYLPLVTAQEGTDLHTRKGKDELPLIALAELDLFTAPSRPVFWWLEDKFDPEAWGQRQRSVHRLVRSADAQSAELLDWLQTAVTSSYSPWAFQPHFTPADDWIYADWQRLFRHAYDRWKAGDGLEWAALAYELYPAHPPSPVFLSQFGFSGSAIGDLDAVYQELGRKVGACSASLSETAAFLAMSRPAAYRLSSGELEAHIDVLERIAEKTRSTLVLRLSYRALLDKHVEDGVPETAASLKARFGPPKVVRASNTDQQRRLAHFFLAKTMDEVVEVYRDTPIDAAALKFLNILPYNAMAELAADARLLPEDRARLARAAFARAYALGQEDRAWELLELVAATNQDLTLAIRFMGDIEGRRKRARALLLFVLRTPRLNTELTERRRPHRFRPEPDSVFQIDRLHHSTRNWWCSLSSEVSSLEQAGKGLRVLLHGGPGAYYSGMRGYRYPAADRNHYRKGWKGVGYDFPRITQEGFSMVQARAKEILREHPIAKAADPEELDALSRIPSAPEALSRGAIAWAQDRGWFRGPDQRAAEALHLAVRSTRYGCQMQGGHGDYSRRAFELLHRTFGDTVWARKTPYWFDACHFYHRPKRCWDRKR